MSSSYAVHHVFPLNSRLCWCVQVADRLSSMGVPCNLVTGQEIRRVNGARHTACTVEMADLATRVDVGHRRISNSS